MRCCVLNRCMGWKVRESRSRLIVHSLEASRLGDGLGEGLGGGVLRMLSQRALVLSQPGDTVVVDSMPDGDWLDFLSSSGFKTGTIRIAHGEGETLAERVMSDESLMSELLGGSWIVEPYMGGEEIEKLAGFLGSDLHAPKAALLNRLNLKSNLCPILGHAGVATIPTTVAARDDAISTARHMLNEYGAVMVRSDLSIGGHGVWKAEGEQDFESLSAGVERSDRSRLFVLQPLLEVTNSPNVQYDISESGAELLGVSAQQMSQSFAFGGNEYPSPLGDEPRLLEQSGRVGQWLYEAEYRGVVGIDFIVTSSGEVFIVEINPRVNTSTFPLMMGKRLGKQAFRLMTGIGVQGVDGFGDLVRGIGEDLMFDTAKGCGVVPLMVPTAGRGVLDAMVFGDDLDVVGSVCDTLMSRALRGELGATR